MEIEPKPTVYNSIQFKSRLEARWAVSLSVFELVKKWRYEPCTIDLYSTPGRVLCDSFTPDFRVDFSCLQYLWEVKPQCPNPQYLEKAAQCTASPQTTPIAIVYGDFYNLEGFRVISFRDGKREYPSPKFLTTWLCPVIRPCYSHLSLLAIKRSLLTALNAGKKYRFDLY